MKAKDLAKIYKNSIVSNSYNENDKYFNYFDGIEYLHIYKEGLKKEEILLLNSMMNDLNLESVWYDFLVKDSTVHPQNVDAITCIHFHVKNLSGHQNTWLESFRSYFDTVYDCFFLNDEYGVLICDSFNANIDKLKGFMSMLDDDYSSNSSLFIGIQTNIDSIKDVFKEEQILFQSHPKSQKIINYVDVYIPHYLVPQMKESAIATNLRKYIENDVELSRLIVSLWQHQGNLSAAAEDLFIHRNTINYRIDKFYKETSLNLRNMQQLLLCYLLTL